MRRQKSLEFPLLKAIRLLRIEIPNNESSWLLVAKALGSQWYPLPLCEYMWVSDGERGSGPEGANDLCLVGFEALGLNLSINYGFKSQGCDLSLQAVT